MNINDVYGAMDDLTGYYEMPRTKLIHVIGREGKPEPIDGFDNVRDGTLYVLGRNNRPAVSGEVADDLRAEVERLRETIVCVYDLMRDNYEEGDWVAFDVLNSEVRRFGE